MDIKYEDFCKESGCMTYKNLNRLRLISEYPELVKRTVIEIIKEIECRHNCPYTPDEFFKWFKEKQLQK